MKVDLLSPEKQARPKEIRTEQRPVKFFLSPVLMIAIFAVSFMIGRATHSQTGDLGLTQLDSIPILGQMRHLISSPDRMLAGEDTDRINILLMGMGGEGHDGANLTDTMMVASIKPKEGKVALLSIPRDLLVPLPNHGWQKINAANAFGEVESPGHGAELARATVEGLLGTDIPYYVRVDFSGFKSVIDSVGGIDVYVDKSFTDYTYPTNDFGVQVISFKQGWTHMSGEEALKYTRSRHGTNGEGSDFARAKRQQKVLAALKDKMLTASTLRSPATIANMLAALQSNVSTNLQIGEIIKLARVVQNLSPQDIVHKVVDNSPSSPLAESTYGGAYVLVPKNDDWGPLRDVEKNVFDIATPDVAAIPPPTDVPPKMDKARVVIQNGTGVSGQARTTATAVSGAGFEVVRIGNANSFGYANSVIYDLTRGQRADDLAKLKAAVGAKDAKSGLPSGLAANDAAGVDFVVIVGQNAL